uniref:VWFA domain-containing protein n=1 Tax=Oreochromis aureus TaxID=47969 RepID=A0A668RN91_OREAU
MMAMTFGAHIFHTHSQNGRGKIYKCTISSQNCQNIPLQGRSIIMYNGVCFQIGPSNTFGTPIPSSPPECRTQVAIAFLLDGSGSVSSTDFQTMKNFVKELIKSLLSSDTQFSVSQFSNSPEVHFNFQKFSSSGSVDNEINGIRQSGGVTYTAKAIRHVVEAFEKETLDSRQNVKKVLIVITDGESNDRHDLGGAAQQAESKNIVRFSIGVGNAFTKTEAKRELDTIASSPSDKHVFQVKNFNALEVIRQNLQDKIFSIEGTNINLLLQLCQKVKTYEDVSFEPDSYLGYSMAIAKTRRGSLTVVGAPRYKHRGVVVAVNRESFENQKIEPLSSQTGEYFGAEVCAMDINNDDITDLIFISAPMYMEPDREGRVYFVCHFCNFDDPLVLRGHAAVKGRFGSSLAVLPDLNSDGFRDLAVGAPLENNGEGSIYIFNGEGGGRISPTYSQRITGSEVESGLKFFGLSISQSSFDQSGDGLPDLAVGSKGTVVLLRSRPIVMVRAEVSFSPKKIPTQNSDCSKPLENTAEICFTMSRVSTVNTAMIHYTITLDATRKPPNNRAYISGKQREQSGSVTVDLGRKACPEDALSDLSNELKFRFNGLASNTNPRPSLAPQAQTTTIHPLGFEINCGTDNKCVDNLKVDFNFTRSSEVKVGIDELLDVTVTVENRGENSYNSRVILTYPVGLSYRKFTSQQGRIECNSVDSEDGLSRGRTDCTIDKPIFKSKTEASFIVSYGIDTNSQLERKIFVTANVTSGNQEHATTSELYKQKSIDVKYSIFITFERHELAFNFTVVIRVPVKLGEKDIWMDLSNLQVIYVSDVLAADFKLFDCSVATCRVFKCNTSMGIWESRMYEISANFSSGWIEQIGFQSAKFLLTSTASLEYDKNQYIYFSAWTKNNPPVHKIEAEIEVYSEPDYIKEIIGGYIGGLAVTALFTVGLYKVRKSILLFFQSLTQLHEIREYMI